MSTTDSPDLPRSRYSVDFSKETKSLASVANTYTSHVYSASHSDDPLLVLEKFSLYKTEGRFYVVASNRSDSRFKVLKIGRDADLAITEDSVIYSAPQMDSLLQMIREGNKKSGGLVEVGQGYFGIVGFVRFTAGWYIVLIKRRAAVALLGGHYVYHCEEAEVVPLSINARSEKTNEESRLLNAFQQVDLSKNFYFSYTYDITNTLQVNLTTVNPKSSPSFKEDGIDEKLSLRQGADQPEWPYNEKFVWNHFLLQPAFKCLSKTSNWVLPMIYGFVDQSKIDVFGRIVYVTLIARRSRHFAGARFLRRGVNEEGYVANDVESEQIAADALTTGFFVPSPSSESKRKPNPRFSSYVQHRGSIPVAWSQDTSNTSIKPPIDLGLIDPWYSAAALHFDDLLKRYGAPIIILNLIKTKEKPPRESLLTPLLKECINYLNQFLPEESRMKYLSFDISAATKTHNVDVVGALEDIAEEVIDKTKFFHSGPEAHTTNTTLPEEERPLRRMTPLLQKGVCRTNCIDCLDRTNAAQFTLGKIAMSHQLHAMGIIDNPHLMFDCDAIKVLTYMYHDHGDTLALQYGGSHLVNTMDTYRKINQWSSHSRDVLEGVKRFYANVALDGDKQTAINLFLGIGTANREVQMEKKTTISKTGPMVTQRRSYVDWFTPEHLEMHRVDLKDADKLLQAAVDSEPDYWIEYYRPRLYTNFEKHFAFTMGSTFNFTKGMPTADKSPFVVRENAHHSTPGLGFGMRGWMSKRSRKKTRSATEPKDDDKTTEPPPSLPHQSGTVALAQKCLNPAVDPEEALEYCQWVEQYKTLNLVDYTDDAIDYAMYEGSARWSRGKGYIAPLKSQDEKMFSDAVSLQYGRPANW